MTPLKPTEQRLDGQWIVRSAQAAPDPVSERIDWLTVHALRKVATDSTGWDTLFVDPQDGRYWEKLYLHSEMHGGGPPSLICIPQQKAKRKYVLP